VDLQIIILILLVIGFAALFTRLNKIFQTSEQDELDDELDDKSKIYLQNAIDNLLKDENSTIFNVLDEQKSAFDKFLVSKGEIDQSIQNVNQQTMNLVSILTDNKSRGDFGEFTVEVLLESAGYVEGSHFVKQDMTKDGKKPDFTFYLANNKKVNMDSKFPLDGYKRIIELEKDYKKPENDEVNKQNIQKSIDRETKTFLNTVRDTIRDTSKKPGYVDINENTIPYMVIYIPVENIFQMLLNSSIPSSGQSFIEYASEQKVMLAGPATLLMQLEIIKHSQKVFAVYEKTSDIAEMNEKFYDEAKNFVDAIEKVHKELTSTQSSFDKLKALRMNKLNARYKDLRDAIDNSQESPLDAIIEEVKAEED
tara:strand:+ start:997 stop:2094 length:1098 start_codon:yes stop_codon:yes gene_type:complete